MSLHAQYFFEGTAAKPPYAHDKSLTEDPSVSVDAVVLSELGLSIEGRDLLCALKRFAVSLVHSPNRQQTELQSSGYSDQLCEVPVRRGSSATESDSLDVQQSDQRTWNSSGLGDIIAGTF